MDENRHSDPKKAAMIKALEGSLGVVSEAIREVGIARSTHYLWMKEDENYKKSVDELQDAVLDFAEAKLHSLIQKGDVAATLFLLKTKGKKRGYVERTEIAAEIKENNKPSWFDNLPPITTTNGVLKES